jgi:hypothetical protein
MTACGAEQGCAALENCILGCGSNYACRAGCNPKRQGGDDFPQIPPLDVCVVTQCESACGVSCGVVAGVGDVDAADGCQACVAANNCPAAEACGRSLSCTEVAQCFGACLTLDCKEACSRGEDAGAALLLAVLTPLQGTCALPCGYGTDWSCVGNVTVPAANGVATVVTLTVETIEGAIVAGATVKACVTSDLECSEPLDTATTNAQGIATLTVRGQLPIGDGFDGYFDIAPGADLDASAQSPAIVPFLDFVDYPFSEPTGSLTATGLTTSDLASFTALGGVSLGDAAALGDLVLIAFDCGLDLAPGVTFGATSGGLDLTPQIRYVSGTGLDPSATATNSTGIALLFGAPALQDVTVTATPAQLGRVAGTQHAFTRAGALSLVSVASN